MLDRAAAGNALGGRTGGIVGAAAGGAARSALGGNVSRNTYAYDHKHGNRGKHKSHKEHRHNGPTKRGNQNRKAIQPFQC